MKCKRCQDEGKLYMPGKFIKCPDCQSLANEEYLRSASVNDMARCIATKLCELARHEYGIYDVVDYATVLEWLKQPHAKSVTNCNE